MTADPRPVLFVTNHAPPYRVPAFRALHERENVQFALVGGDLRHGGGGTATSLPSDFIVNLSDGQLFDALAIQIDGPRAGDRRIALHWRMTDTGAEYSVTLEHGVLTHRAGAPSGKIA